MDGPTDLQKEAKLKDPSSPQTVKPVGLTGLQSLAAKLEAKLDRSDESANEENSFDDARKTRSASEMEADEETGSENGNVTEEVEKDKNEDEDKNKHTEKPLIEEDDSIRIEINEEGVDTATLPLNKDKTKETIDIDTTDIPPKKKPSMFLFPFTRMKLAWTASSNVCDFIIRATVIIFSTLGWLFCVGGIPFISIAMLVIGSVYIEDCKLQPYIPVYLIVAGVFGTLQHFMSIWTKYLPKESQGRIRVYRSYCRVFDGIIQLFLTIWFVVGCVWVYGIYSEVDYDSPYKDEYCHKTLYRFAFWILNLSFIVLAIVVSSCLCCILCIAGSSQA